MQANTTAVYQCPGEAYPISPAIHLGRLASFYPKCRQCSHCHETGTLSTGVVKMLNETRNRTVAESLFTAEGISGVYLNDLSPLQTRQFAAAFGLSLARRDSGEQGGIVLAGDGRDLAPELMAAASDGLRWSGRDVVDLGAASAPCLSQALRHLQAAGGLLVGNASGQANMVGLKLWGADGRPLSAGPELDAIRKLCAQGVDRPTRSYGALSRFQPESPYLAGLEEFFHALRPLRLVLDTGCRPLIGYLRKLSASVACELLLSREAATSPAARGLGLAERIRGEQAHFGIWIDGDGEACRVVDERGARLTAEQTLSLLADYVLQKQPGASVIVEQATCAATVERIAAAGGRVTRSGASRAEMHAAMSARDAALGGGPSGRYWYGARPPLADGLRTLSLLLTILSQSDRPLSETVRALG
jgi:phosphomannomutase